MKKRVRINKMKHFIITTCEGRIILEGEFKPLRISKYQLFQIDSFRRHNPKLWRIGTFGIGINNYKRDEVIKCKQT